MIPNQHQQWCLLALLSESLRACLGRTELDSNNSARHF
jgi:hypothetical protein